MAIIEYKNPNDYYVRNDSDKNTETPVANELAGRAGSDLYGISPNDLRENETVTITMSVSRSTAEKGTTTDNEEIRPSDKKAVLFFVIVVVLILLLSK